MSLKIKAPLQRRKEIEYHLSLLPAFVVRAARISSLETSSDPMLAAQIAAYEHGSRRIRVWHQLTGGALQMALTHEIGHAVDDNLGSPHVFSAHPVWRSIHRSQSNFDIPKYAEQPLEYFADMFAKYWIFGSSRLRLTLPEETAFIDQVVVPALKQVGG